MAGSETLMGGGGLYSNILVALDGSELAEQVLPHVEALADKFGSRVTLLRATTQALPGPVPMGLPMAQPVSAYTMETFADAVKEERQAAEEYLQTVAQQMGSMGIRAETRLREGPAAEAILDEAAALGANLIAMTTQGRGGLGRLVLGSVADQVIRSSTCPVLLIRVTQNRPTE